MFDYQLTEHDVFLLELMQQAASTSGLDGVPRDPLLRAAHAIEEYATHRAIAAVMIGISAKDLNVREAELLGAYADARLSIPDTGFPSPLNRGKPWPRS